MRDDPIETDDVSADLAKQRDGTHSALSDPQRLQALDISNVLSSGRNPTFDRAVKLARRVLDAPTSLVVFVDSARQHFKAQEGLSGPAAEAQGTPLSHSFCKHVVARGEPMSISDARIDPDLKNNMAVSEMGVIAYLGVPIRASGGEVLGSFCVIDSKPRPWTPRDQETLTDLASMIEMELSLQDAVSQRDIVVQEMNHRIKNLFSLVGSMVRLDKRNHDSLDGFVESLTSRIGALDAAHKMIVPVGNAHLAVGQAAELQALISKILKPHSGPNEQNIRVSGDPVQIGPRSTVYMTLAIHELATNAAKHGAFSAEDGSVDVACSLSGDVVDLVWTEAGFAWDSAKWETKDLGFGSRLLEISISGQLGGTLSTQIDPDRLQHRISLPLAGLEY